MAELAELEIRVNTKAAKTAAGDLDKLDKASDKATKSTDKLAASDEKLTKSRQKRTKASKEDTKATQKEAKATTDAAKAAIDAKAKVASLAAAKKKLADRAREAAERLRKFDTATRASAKSLGAYRAEARKASAAQRQLSKDTAGTTKALQGAILAFGALQVASKVITIFATLEQKTANLRAVMQGTTEEMAKLTTQSDKLGANTKFSASQVVEAQTALAKAGQTTFQIISSIPGVLNLASAANLSLAESSDIVSKTLSQFSLGADQTGLVVDTLTAAANSANTNVQELAAAMSFAAPIAAQLGKPIEEVAQLLAVLAKNGITASSAGTNLRGIMLALLRPSGQAAAKIKELGERSGQTAADFDIATKSTKQVIAAFKKAGANTKDLTAVFGRLNTGAFSILQANLGTVFDDIGNKIENASGLAQKMADIQNDTLIGSLHSLVSAFEALSKVIGAGKLGKLFRDLVDALALVVRRMGGLNDESKEVSRNIEILASGWKIAIFVLKVFIAQLIVEKALLIATRIATIATTIALKGFRAALSSTGVGLLIVGLGSLVGWLLETEDAADEAAGNLEDLGKKAVNTAGDIDKTTAALARFNKEAANAKVASDALVILTEFRDRQKQIEQTKQAIINTNKGFDAKAVAQGQEVFRKRLKINKLLIAEEIKGIRDLTQADRALAKQQGLLSKIQDRLVSTTGKVASARDRDIIARNFAIEDGRKVNNQIVELKGLQEDLRAAQQKTNKSTKKQREEVDKLAQFWQKLRDRLEDSIPGSRLEKDAKKLAKRLSKVLKESGFSDVDIAATRASNLQDILNFLNKIADNKAFEQLTNQGKVAIKSIAEAVKASEADLAEIQGGGSGTRAATEREFAEALRVSNALLDEQVRRELVSAAIAEKQKAALKDKVKQIADNRVEAEKFLTVQKLTTEALEQNNDALLEFQQLLKTINEGDIDFIPKTQGERIDRIKEISKALEAVRMRGQEARAEGAITSAELERQMADVTRAYTDAVQTLAGQALIGMIQQAGHAITESFGNAFKEVVLGAKTAKEAAIEFGLAVIDVLFTQFVITPLVQLLQSVISDGIQTIIGLKTTAAAATATASITLAAAGKAAGTAIATGGAGAGTAMTGGAATAGTTLTTAGVAVAASIVAGAAQAAAILGIASAGKLAAGAAANGAVVDNGVMMFRSGGIIQNSQALNGGAAGVASGILNGPVSFPLRGGATGIAGEAGPEAIVPLRRQGGGFAVEAQAGGSAGLVELARLNSGNLGVRLFEHGGIFDKGKHDTNLAQPQRSTRAFTGTGDTPGAPQRTQVINMTVNTPNASRFKRSQRQISRRLQQGGL